jgi:hypothetical protein
MRGILTATILAMIASSAMPAMACSIMPPPPPPVLTGGSALEQAASDKAWNDAHYKLRVEEDRAWKLKQQVKLFDDAGSIGVFRYDRASKVSGMPKEFDYMNGDPLSILKPVRWVKGKGSPAELTLGMVQPPPCGQIPAHDAFYGSPGDVFVIFLAADGHVLDGLKFENVVEPRTLAALTAR